MHLMPGESMENWDQRAKYVEGAFRMLVGRWLVHQAARHQPDDPMPPPGHVSPALCRACQQQVPLPITLRVATDEARRERAVQQIPGRLLHQQEPRNVFIAGKQANLCSLLGAATT